MQLTNKPRVCVLLATCNGIDWIDEQLDSILNQENVDVTVLVSDDHSTDGTMEYIANRSVSDSRIKPLPKKQFGSPAKNFYRLLMDVDIQEFDYFALADQDDIWLSDKLIRLSKALTSNQADGVSSNSVAFWEDGSRALIDKAQPFRRFDYLFESAGPGCTFLISPKLLSKVKNVLKYHWDIASEIRAHDWLIYATCRANGLGWFISSTPTVKYRQHANNALGVNLGLKARLFRLRQILSGNYRRQVQKIAEFVSKTANDPELIQHCNTLLAYQKIFNFKMLKLMNQSRRRRSDRYFLIFAVMTYLF